MTGMRTASATSAGWVGGQATVVGGAGDALVVRQRVFCGCLEERFDDDRQAVGRVVAGVHVAVAGVDERAAGGVGVLGAVVHHVDELALDHRDDDRSGVGVPWGLHARL